MSNTLFLLSDATNNQKVELQPLDSEEAIVGGIILNRIVGIAYDKLVPQNFNRETIKNLKFLKNYYHQQYIDFIEKLKYLSEIFKEANYNYCFLKGAFLIPTLYSPGQRISNDIDLLINPCDASKVHSHLTGNGFVQGHCDEREVIIPATRKEIIYSKMNSGETVPYLRYYNNILIEIDINFSLDFKAKGSENIVRDFLNKGERAIISDKIEFKTLQKQDFLIHLCCHLFKEATTYDWLVNRRDLMLYKFSDINMFLNKFATQEFLTSLANRIVELGLEKECYYTFYNSSRIYPHIHNIIGFQNLLDTIKPESTEYMFEIIYPLKKAKYKYNISFEDWFSSANRINHLIQEE